MNSIKINSPLRTVIGWSVVTVLAVFGIFAPFIFGMKGFDGGFAIAALCFFLAISGLVVIIIYAGRAITVRKILSSENILAHWKYNRDEWDRYAEAEYKTEKQGKKTLFFIIAGMALFCGIVFYIIDRESGGWVMVVMIGLIAVIAFTAWFTSWYNYRQNKNSLGETYITKEAVYINRYLHTWHGLGSKLESVNLIRESARPILAITYSMPTNTGIEQYTVRVLVPGGKETEAETIVHKLS